MNTALVALLLAQVTAADLDADSRLDASVDMSVRATSCTRVVSQLGDAKGVPLRSVAMFSQQPLVLQLNGAKLKDVMRGIAEAVGGEWQKEETGYLLARSDTQWRALKKADDDVLIKLIQEAKPGWSEEEFPDVATEAGGVARAQPATPEVAGEAQGFQKLANSAIKLVPPSNLVSMGLYERVVFSARPNSMQRSLSGLKGQVLDPAIRAYKVPTAPNRPHVDPETGEVIEDETPNAPGPLVGAHLIVTRDSPLTWGATLKLFDQTGVSLTLGTSISVDSGAAKLIPTRKPVDPKQKVELHPLSKKLIELGRMFMNEMPSNFETSPELKAAFRTPDEVDPLFTIPTDFALAFAKAEKQNLVACLADDTFSGGPGTEVGAEESLESAYSMFSDHVTVPTGTVVSLHPQFRSYSQITRMDRKAVRKYLEAEASGLSVQAMKDFAVTYPENSEQLLVMVGLLSGSSVSSIFGGSQDWSALRFLASLNATQEAALTEGKTLAYGSMSASQRNAYYYCTTESSGQSFMFGGGDMEELMTPTSSDAEPEVTYPDITDLLGGQASAVAHVLGIPSVKDVVKLADTSKFPFPLPALSASEYAMIKQSMDQPESAAFSHMFPKLEPVYPGVRRTLKMEFKVVPGVKVTHRVSTDTVSAKAVKYAELPAAFRKAVETFKIPWGDGGPVDGPPPIDPNP